MNYPWSYKAMAQLGHAEGYMVQGQHCLPCYKQMDIWSRVLVSKQSPCFVCYQGRTQGSCLALVGNTHAGLQCPSYFLFFRSVKTEGAFETRLSKPCLCVLGNSFVNQDVFSYLFTSIFKGVSNTFRTLVNGKSSHITIVTKSSSRVLTHFLQSAE